MSAKRRGSRPALSTGPPIQFSASISRFLRSSGRQPMENRTSKMADPSLQAGEQSESTGSGENEERGGVTHSPAVSAHCSPVKDCDYMEERTGAGQKMTGLAAASVQAHVQAAQQRNMEGRAGGKQMEECRYPDHHSNEVAESLLNDAEGEEDQMGMEVQLCTTQAQPVLPRSKNFQSQPSPSEGEVPRSNQCNSGKSYIPWGEEPWTPVKAPIVQNEAGDVNPQQATNVINLPSAYGTQMHGAPGGEVWDSFKTRLLSIPTKEELVDFVSRLEASFKAEAEALRGEVTELTDKVSHTDSAVDKLTSRVQAIEDKMAVQTSNYESYMDSLEDLENRERRQNIRVRGLPESVHPSELNVTLQSLFNSIRNVPIESTIEFDRAHRSLGPPPPEGARPRDVICRLHRYQIKEEIMNSARRCENITFQGGQIQLMADLSRRTLQKRRALKPLLDILRQHQIPYSWGYPFRLQVRRGNQLVSLSHPREAQAFLSSLDLPRMDLTSPDWPDPLSPVPDTSTLREQRNPIGRKRGRGGLGRRRNRRAGDMEEG